MKVVEINSLVLAYLGDAIYEEHVRRYFIEKGISHVKELQEIVIPIVSAKGQAHFLEVLQQQNFFTEEELTVLHRARNTKSHPSKSCDILTYKHATALEAIIGYWALNQKNERITQMMKKILEEIIC